MKKFILLISTLGICILTFAEENLLTRMFLNVDGIRMRNWEKTCSLLQLENTDDKITFKSNGYEVSGDTLLLVELYTSGPGSCFSMAYQIDSDSVLSIDKDSIRMKIIEKYNLSCEYKLYSTIKRRDFEQLEKWNKKLIVETSTPVFKYYVTMFYKSNGTIFIKKWSFFYDVVRHTMMKEYLLEQKKKNKDFFFFDFDYWINDD